MEWDRIHILKKKYVDGLQFSKLFLVESTDIFID